MGRSVLTQRTTVGAAPAGSILRTDDGVLFVKSEYFYPLSRQNRGFVCLCILLASGEYAHFDRGNDEPVEVLDLPSILAERDAMRPIVAAAMAWLAANDSDDLTGIKLTVDLFQAASTYRALAADRPPKGS
jgi:hypothetical protein